MTSRHDRPVALKVLHPELSANSVQSASTARSKRLPGCDHPHILACLRFRRTPRAALVHDALRGGGKPARPAPARGPVAVRGSRSDRPRGGDALDYAHAGASSTVTSSPRTSCSPTDRRWWPTSGWPRRSPPAARASSPRPAWRSGTPAYMSPEQASGGPGGRPVRCLRLGCVLYEMLAGEPPFTGPTPQAVIAKRLLEPVPHVRTLRESVPEEADERSCGYSPGHPRTGSPRPPSSPGHSRGGALTDLRTVARRPAGYSPTRSACSLPPPLSWRSCSRAERLSGAWLLAPRQFRSVDSSQPAARPRPSASRHGKSVAVSPW